LSYTPTGPKRLSLIRAVSSISGALFARVKRPRAVRRLDPARPCSSRTFCARLHPG